MGLGNGFYEKLNQVAQEVGMKPEDILLIMCSESGLNPHVAVGKSRSSVLEA